VSLPEKGRSAAKKKGSKVRPPLVRKKELTSAQEPLTFKNKNKIKSLED